MIFCLFVIVVFSWNIVQQLFHIVAGRIIVEVGLLLEIKPMVD